MVWIMSEKAQQKLPVKNVRTIAAGQPFARVLAQGLLEESGEEEGALGRTLVLLPTRRACHVLREAFLSVRQGRALLLPRMQPIGDLDEEELSLAIAGREGAEKMLSIPPAISAMRREILLSRLVRAREAQQSSGQDSGDAPALSLSLASALGRLMDQIHTENLDLGALGHIVPEELAEHWQVTLRFLEILSVHWPEILREEGVCDPAERRNRLILALADLWEKSPPPQRVIAAGSTGSIPATARLLSVIAGMERGCVVLPGLDREMDEESWEALGETHPQYGFRHLLHHMGVSRHQVGEWGGQPAGDSREAARRFLAREIMRPAETVKHWAGLSGEAAAVREALGGVSLLTCEHEREEAESIAVLLRRTAGEPGRTACLITPDRNLALRVASVCRRWGIEIDDSAGRGLDKTPAGVFLLLALGAVESGFAPADLLALLKHPLCRIGGDGGDHDAGVAALDRGLRGPSPAKGLEGISFHVASQQNMSAAQKEAALEMLERLRGVFAPVLDLWGGDPVSLESLMKAHIALCEALAGDDEALWSGPAGQAASALLSGLLEQSEAAGPLAPGDYGAVLLHFMQQVTVRPVFGAHPRLQILGQLEARLVDADLVILGGLNEGVWPPDPGADPWMSRPMRKEFGLPSMERGTGLAAHDFVQGFCAPQVVMTRSRRVQGAPSVPARWLQRLGAVLQAAGLEGGVIEDVEIQGWVRAMDRAEGSPRPAQRPAPRPPPEKRPRRLSVTQVETWMKDPYSIYARHILGLRKLDPLEQPVDAAALGSLLHDILDRFVAMHKDALPLNARGILYEIAAEELARRGEDPAIWSFWWPRFSRICDWLVEHEEDWRARASVLATEAKGQIALEDGGQPFILTARADRIDRLDGGGAAIIDYKSGGSYSRKKIRSGVLPQLPLEGLILRQGGFEGIAPVRPESLQYWILNGGGEGGKIAALDEDVEAVLEKTHEGLVRLIAIYDDPATAYPSLPRPAHAPAYNDYEHLARVREWNVAGDEDDGESAEEAA